MTNSKQLLRTTEASDLTTLAKSTINLWVAQGKFPKPIMLSPTIKVWQLQQVTDWIEQRGDLANQDTTLSDASHEGIAS